MTTQFASASYQEIIDLHTESDTVSVIGIHTPVTSTPYRMLKGLFDTYQRYRYDGCSLSLVPAARLPADISQVSYESGEPPIDARDLLNPILWHGCHGESLGSVLNQFYSIAPNNPVLWNSRVTDSADMADMATTTDAYDAVMESLYYRALTDTSWLKAHPQRGFRKSGLHPMVYDVSTDRQFQPSNIGTLRPRFPVGRGDSALLPSGDGGLGANHYTGTMGTGASATISMFDSQGIIGVGAVGSDPVETIMPNHNNNQLFTSRLHNLGWLDTRHRLQDPAGPYTTQVLENNPDDRQKVSDMFTNIESDQTINYLPRLFMGMILMPPAYKTEQYFRLVLNHRFSFKKFRGVSMGGGDMDYGSAANYFDLN